MNPIALTHPDRINMMLSFRVSCGNVWFAFGPLLAYDAERQKLSFSVTCQHQNWSEVIIPLENIFCVLAQYHFWEEMDFF